MYNDTIERRGSVRRKTLKAGKIVFNGRSSAFDCTIRNMSETGAKVVVMSSLGIPAWSIWISKTARRVLAVSCDKR
ncbi:hypothetical protein GCM10023069_69420 [Shinella granuli]